MLTEGFIVCNYCELCEQCTCWQRGLLSVSTVNCVSTALVVWQCRSHLSILYSIWYSQTCVSASSVYSNCEMCAQLYTCRVTVPHSPLLLVLKLVLPFLCFCQLIGVLQQLFSQLGRFCVVSLREVVSLFQLNTLSLKLLAELFSFPKKSSLTLTCAAQ